MLGATTLTEYRKYIDKDPALERRFRPVTVEEPGQEATVNILQALKPGLERHHHIRISEEAIREAARPGRTWSRNYTKQSGKADMKKRQNCGIKCSGW